MKAQLLGKCIKRYGDFWIIEGYHQGFDMFHARRVGSCFRCLVPTEEV